MLIMATCASVLCFAPELSLYTPSANQQPRKLQMQWPTSVASGHTVNIPDIVVSVQKPLRYLAESEQRLLDRALLRSIKIVHQGLLLK